MASAHPGVPNSRNSNLFTNTAQLRPKTDSARRRRMQLEIERKLRGLLTKDKQKAEEEAALAVGLCRSVP